MIDISHVLILPMILQTVYKILNGFDAFFSPLCAMRTSSAYQAVKKYNMAPKAPLDGPKNCKKT